MSPTTKKISIIVMFVVIGFIAMQIPFSKLLGATNLRFSLFDFYGPIIGAFVGSLPGVLLVFVMQLVNWAINGFQLDTATIIRFFPILAAALYFAKHTRWTLMIPLFSILAFLAHPEGRNAWPFALYWIIPFVAYPFSQKYIFARALGATFTQHALGGALWIWGLNMKATLWMSLIPIVWKERLLMALGITLTYIAFNYLLSLAARAVKLEKSFLTLNPKYSVSETT